MSSLSLQSPAKPNTLDQRIFNLLDGYLSNSTPASETAKAINALTPAQESDDIENFLWSTWDIFIQIAKQIPHDHAWQDRLVEVIKALTELPSRTIPIWESETRLWMDLPILGPSLRESWNPPTYPSNQQATNEWTNLNAFTARLLRQGNKSLSVFAVWSLRSALEEEPQGAERDGEVAAAAMWMLYSGKVVFDLLNNAVVDEQTKRMMKPGSLYTGQDRGVERWRFWKRRFEEVHGEVGNETKGVVRSAKENMEMVEGIGQ